MDLTVITTSAVTSAAVGLGLHGALAWRPSLPALRTRRAAAEHSAKIWLDDINGTHLGPCLAVLRGRYGKAQDDTVTVTDHTGYDELLRSCIEVIFLTVHRHAELMLDLCECGEEDCTTAAVLETISPGLHDPLSIEFLLRVAHSFERVYASHADDHALGRCDCDEPDGAYLQHRATLAREIANDLATNDEGTILVTPVPIQAAFGVAYTCIETIAANHGPTPEEQVDHLSRGLVRTIGLVDHVRLLHGPDAA